MLSEELFNCLVVLICESYFEVLNLCLNLHKSSSHVAFWGGEGGFDKWFMIVLNLLSISNVVILIFVATRRSNVQILD